MDAQVKRAVELTRRGVSANKIAQELGVNRSTVTRWKQTQEFQEALKAAPSTEDVASLARDGLAQMVPEALSLIERAMRSDISAAKMNSALSVIRLAIETGPTAGGGDSTLRSRLMELERRSADAGTGDTRDSD